MSIARTSASTSVDPDRGNGGGRSKRAAHLTPGGLRWILPGFILSVGLIYYSIIYSGYLSFFEWGGGRGAMTFVGLDNFAEAFSDPAFWTALRNTAIYFVAVFAVQVVGGVLFAAAMHSKVYLKTVYKIIVIVPVVVAPATMAQAHIQVWQTNGTMNSILNSIGLESLAQPWIGQSSTAFWVITLVGCWGSIGFGFILFYAAMAQVDLEMLEAARMDGAGNFRVLWSIVLPNLKPITISLAILNFITALRLFDTVWLITQGGPAGSSEFLGTLIYSETAGTQRNLGYAAALSIILLVIAVSASILIQRRGRERPEKALRQPKAKEEDAHV
jgi:raffinose/stachyose/melibiose transport system permease protein